MQKRGQIAIMDLFLAVAIFTIIIVIVGVVWNMQTKRFEGSIAQSSMQIKAFQATDLLVKNPGVKTEWEENLTVLAIPGLSTNDRTISEAKASNFTSLDYDLVRQLLNIQEYEFYFRLLDDEGELIISSGKAPIATTSSVAVRRFVHYKDNLAILELTLWA